jgi:hypothetical protein
MLHARPFLPFGFAAAFAASLGGCFDARPDDGMEPNDDLASATPLVLGAYVDGRANQGDPDVFSVAVPAGETLYFALKDRGLEDCAGFTVATSTTDIVYQDTYQSCSHSSLDEPIMNGAVRADIEGFGYEIEIASTVAATYFLTILEHGTADNVAPFSWDYSIRASLDESVNP